MFSFKIIAAHEEKPWEKKYSLNDPNFPYEKIYFSDQLFEQELIEKYNTRNLRSKLIANMDIIYKMNPDEFSKKCKENPLCLRGFCLDGFSDVLNSITKQELLDEQVEKKIKKFRKITNKTYRKHFDKRFQHQEFTGACSQNFVLLARMPPKLEVSDVYSNDFYILKPSFFVNLYKKNKGFLKINQQGKDLAKSNLEKSFCFFLDKTINQNTQIYVISFLKNQKLTIQIYQEFNASLYLKHEKDIKKLPYLKWAVYTGIDEHARALVFFEIQAPYPTFHSFCAVFFIIFFLLVFLINFIKKKRQDKIFKKIL